MLLHKDMRCVGECGGFPLVTSPLCKVGKIHLYTAPLFFAFPGFEDANFWIIGRDQEGLEKADSQGVIERMLEQSHVEV